MDQPAAALPLASKKPQKADAEPALPVTHFFRRPAPRQAAFALLCCCLISLGPAVPAFAGAQLLVTVVDKKTGKAVTDLKAGDFTVVDNNTPRPVLHAEYRSRPVDVMLLIDSSMVGEAVRGVAADLIAQLQEKEQMAIVAYHSSADLVQDFTASRETLAKALSSIRYGNEPKALDAIFAAADGGFRNAVLRRVILLLTAGLEGYSRVSERTVIRVARRNAISIYTLYLSGRERDLFEELARQTGGASFNIQDVGRAAGGNAARQIFETVRGHYILELRGNLSLGEKVKVEINGRKKLAASALPLE